MYVICVYSTTVSVFSATNGTFLEETAKLDKTIKIDNYNYDCAAVNPMTGEIITVSNNRSGSKKQI